MLMMASTAALNLAMVLFHREMSGRLNVGYADFATVNGLVGVAGILLSGSSTWLTRVLSHEAALGGELAANAKLKALAPALLGGSLAISLALGAAVLLLRDWLHLATGNPAPWAAAMLLGGLLLLMARSLVQAAHRFGLLAASFMLEALGKALVPALLVGAMGVAGAFAGMAGVTAVLALTALPILWAPRPGHDTAEAENGAAPTLRSLARDSAALACFSLVGFLDLFVYKNVHGGADPAVVDFYSRGALVGKSFLYLASAFNLVALPAISAAHARGQDVLKLLRRFLLAMAGVLGLGALLLWAFTPFALDLLLSPRPENAALVPVARLFALAVAPLALFQLVLYHGLAVGAPGFTRLLALAALLYYGALRTWHASPLQVIACLAAVSSGLLFAGLWLAWRAEKRAREDHEA